MKKLLIGLLAAIALVVLIGVMLPSNIQVSQSILIHTPADMVFEEVNNLKQWNHWSPWQKEDPTTVKEDPITVMTYEGPDSGVGCKMIWDSKNPKLGKGSQEIIKSIPNRHIEVALNFASWKHHTRSNWDFEERENNSTQVTWSYTSHIRKNIWHKYMAIIIKPSLEKDYIKGLQQLKTHVEQKMASVN